MRLQSQQLVPIDSLALVVSVSAAIAIGDWWATSPVVALQRVSSATTLAAAFGPGARASGHEEARASR